MRGTLILVAVAALLVGVARAEEPEDGASAEEGAPDGGGDPSEADDEGVPDDEGDPDGEGEAEEAPPPPAPRVEEDEDPPPPPAPRVEEDEEDAPPAPASRIDEDDDEDGEDDDGPSYFSDVSHGWFHVGGGFGFVDDVELLSMGGRFALGAGGYTFGFYGGGGFEMDFRLEVPIKVHGVGYIGVAIPVPVVHPLFGFKIAGGAAVIDPLGTTLAPVVGSVAVGGQAGFIVRKFGGGPGFRFMVEPALSLVGLDEDGRFELWFVFAGVF